MSQVSIYNMMLDYAKDKCISEEMLRINNSIIEDCAKQAADCLIHCIAKINKINIVNILSNHIYKLMFDIMERELREACYTYHDDEFEDCNYLYTREEVDTILQDNEVEIHGCAKKMVSSCYSETDDLSKWKHPDHKWLWLFISFSYSTKKVFCPI